MHHPTDRIAHTTAFVTPVLDHWPEREIAQCVHPTKDRSDDPSHHERTLLPWSYISLPKSRYRVANPVPTSPLADDITTAPSGAGCNRCADTCYLTRVVISTGLHIRLSFKHWKSVFMFRTKITQNTVYLFSQTASVCLYKCSNKMNVCITA